MTVEPGSRRRLRAEVLLVLGVSLGQAGVFAIWTLVERYLKETPIGRQTTTIHPASSSVPIMDLIHQVLAIGFSLVPVALAAFLLSAKGEAARDRLGLRWGNSRPTAWRDVAWGCGLAAAIGIPGLGLYVAGRTLGQTVKISASGLPDAWWAVTILLLAAAATAVLEEVVAVGYLVTRLRDLAWRPWTCVAASAVLRGSYHLYQGWPMAVGNAVMGAIFAAFFLRTRRVGPLIGAHFLLDLVSFVGPEVVPESWLDALHVA